MHKFLPQEDDQATIDENRRQLIEKLIEKASANGDRLTENRIAILRLIIANPQITKMGLAQAIGSNVAVITNNLEVMRNKYIRRVGTGRNGFWGLIM
ncbi:MAG: hypothetical protein J1E57_01010 [Prevotella sp.]|nr:hypothetical protein [Prevotella sp.]